MRSGIPSGGCTKRESGVLWICHRHNDWAKWEREQAELQAKTEADGEKDNKEKPKKKTYTDAEWEEYWAKEKEAAGMCGTRSTRLFHSIQRRTERGTSRDVKDDRNDPHGSQRLGAQLRRTSINVTNCTHGHNISARPPDGSAIVIARSAKSALTHSKNGEPQCAMCALEEWLRIASSSRCYESCASFRIPFSRCVEVSDPF